jgi:phospholipid/cholesterol/gamma-HCH transport system ATP-binding protein
LNASISVRDVWKSFEGKGAFEGEESAVLRGVSFELDKEGLAGLIGPSGGGKSVLLKIIAGIAEPDRGRVEKSVETVSFMFQEGALFDSLNVFDNVAFPLVNGTVPTELLPEARQLEAHAKVDAILDRVGLLWASHKMPGELSGGMRRRVSLARALVLEPDLALLDDPTSGLDPVASSVIMELIVELQRERRTAMLIVSQDLRRLLPAVDRIFALFDGTIAFEGSLAELVMLDNATVRHFVECRFDFTERGNDERRRAGPQ